MFLLFFFLQIVINIRGTRNVFGVALDNYFYDIME